MNIAMNPLRQMGSAFLTGSRVYGKPREDSDYDVVVQVDLEAMIKIREEHGDPPYKFGPINIIPIACPQQFHKWKHATYHAIDLDRPIPREEAVEIFRALGVNGDGSSRKERQNA